MLFKHFWERYLKKVKFFEFQTIQDARDSCQSIQDAENATGIFQVCAPLGQAVLEHLFDDCIYDVCLTPIDRCPTLDAFVEQCQSEIPCKNLTLFQSTPIP